MICEPTDDKITAAKTSVFTTAPPIVNNTDAIYLLNSTKNDKQ